MLRTAAAVPVHALCSAFYFFTPKVHVLIVCMYISMYISMYIFMCVCMYKHLKAKQSVKTVSESSGNRDSLRPEQMYEGKTVRCWRLWLHPERAGINRNLLQKLRGKC